MTIKKKTTTITKPKLAIKSASTFTTEQMNRRMIALGAAAQLVSNPVHAFAATPQNVMELAGVFTHWAEGKDMPARPAEAEASAPQVQTYN